MRAMSRAAASWASGTDQLCTTSSGTWWMSASSAAQRSARSAAGDSSIPTTTRSGPPRLAGPRTTTTAHGLRCTRCRGVLPSQNAAAPGWLLAPTTTRSSGPTPSQERFVDRTRRQLGRDRHVRIDRGRRREHLLQSEVGGGPGGLERLTRAPTERVRRRPARASRSRRRSVAAGDARRLRGPPT